MNTSVNFTTANEMLQLTFLTLVCFLSLRSASRKIAGSLPDYSKLDRESFGHCFSLKLFIKSPEKIDINAMAGSLGTEVNSIFSGAGIISNI